MKKLYLPILVVLLAAFALAGCGVSQEDYDNVASDLAAAQTELVRLETELASAQDLSRKLQEDLDATLLEYESCNAVVEEGAVQMTNLQTEYDDQSVLLEETAQAITSASVYKDILIELLAPAVTGDSLDELGTIDAIRKIVDQSGDQDLKTKFEAWSADPKNKELVLDVLGQALLKLEELIF